MFIDYIDIMERIAFHSKVRKIQDPKGNRNVPKNLSKKMGSWEYLWCLKERKRNTKWIQLCTIYQTAQNFSWPEHENCLSFQILFLQALGTAWTFRRNNGWLTCSPDFLLFFSWRLHVHYFLSRHFTRTHKRSDTGFFMPPWNQPKIYIR